MGEADENNEPANVMTEAPAWRAKKKVAQLQL